MKFKLISDFSPTGDQPQAISKLIQGVKGNKKEQVLLGVTGSGKTYTLANVVEKLQLPTLVISHNKTLAGQLYQEFRDFFPGNAVSYFVSYYDYYQPEAYLPATDTYIEKEAEINEEIDKLRLAATTNLLTRKDTLVVASVSCIYNIGSPREYGKFVMELRAGMHIDQEQIIERLVDLQYERHDYDFKRGAFRVRGETIDVRLAYSEHALRLQVIDSELIKMFLFNPISGDPLENETLKLYIVYPAKHYMTDMTNIDAVEKIRNDLEKQIAYFKKQGKELEAHRINKKVNFDLDMIQEVGYVNGIENYSRYFDGRSKGDPPYTLIDYYRETYKDDWLLVIDESHMTIPQLNGMYKGDRSRKDTLIEFGFRLPAARDNRPYKFSEFLSRMPSTIYVSATPAPWELKRADKVVKQLVRPTGLLDPDISVRPIKGQVQDLAKEIEKRVKQKQRVLVTTLTKRMAEELNRYLNKMYKAIMKTAYLHSDIDTLKRQEILENLRKGEYDVLVGINLLREGLDLPEVSLVAILDADKEGFLRSKTSLIQTMGRAARHEEGAVIMYADTVTRSMREAISEVKRRRSVQESYNKKHNILPHSIQKPIREKLVNIEETRKAEYKAYEKINVDSLTPKDRKEHVKKLTILMKQAARDLDFEEAARIRDRVRKIEAIDN